MEICNISVGFSGNSIPRAEVLRNLVFISRVSKSPLLRCAAVDALRESDSRNRMFILGMGYVGQLFAQELKSHGWVVSGTCTSTSKMKKLKERGFNLYTFDANDPDPRVLTSMKYHTHLLVSIPPIAGLGDPMLQHEQILRTKLTFGNLRWLCYLSSTNVYGNSGGAWVDEDYSICSTRSSALLRVAAEEKWLDLGHELGLSAQIFRLGGIYGPGRSAINTIIKQMPPSETQRRRAFNRYTSRIHVADICQALKASIRMPNPRSVYNIVDDDPAPRAEVFAFAEHLIEQKWPNQIKQYAFLGRLESPIPERGSEGEKQIAEPFILEKDFEGEKRVSNARMKKDLRLKLLCPNYRSGLRNIIDHLENPFK